MLDKLIKKTLGELAKINSLEELQDLEVKILGRKGALTNHLRGIKDVPGEEKKAYGENANKAKKTLEEAFDQKKSELKEAALNSQLTTENFDLSEPGIKPEIGHIHPLSKVQWEVENIFSQMGFSIMDGPEVESEYYNFEGLNIPKHHPARDMQDTFFLDKEADKKHGRLVLRTHTSPVQIRTMEKYGAPLRIIIPGRVFRYEATDASHDTTFDQVEGMLIDKDISLSHLKGILQEFLTRLFQKEVKVRLRPGYFPFVEPGLEVDFSCLLCGGEGCRVCKNTGWLEFMGAGMIHKNVLKAGGVDPKKYQGWAFGFGLTRLVMMRYGIDDIRLLKSADPRFLTQF
ncbi:MAG: phenylalanine--tRNA ligase subunit alpha [Patescibacteria group bacterium]|nr:phenylalanine--tRNA ligase subunit alpha [Patescibacteria group bacterium]